MQVFCRLVFCFALLVGLSFTASAAIIVDFEDLTLPPESAAPGDAAQSPFVTSGVTFNRTWSTEYDCCPGGWAYSNQTDQQTPGVNSSFSAYAPPTGGGVHGSTNFAVANNYAHGDSTIDFPEPVRVQSMYVTNTTYVYRAVVDGDDGAGFVKGPFQDGDRLHLEIFGVGADDQTTGKAELDLAHYQDGNSSVLTDWTWVDLTGLGKVQRLEFALTSTDSGPFGMNTPAYFAVDDLSFVMVPEPISMIPLGWAGGWLAVITSRRRRRQELGR